VATVTVRFDPILRKLMAGASPGVRAAVARGLNQAGQILEFKVKERVPVNTGALRRSIGYKLLDDRTLTVGSMHPVDGRPLAYAAQVEFGGTIRPRNARFLAIPLSHFRGNTVMTKSGVGGISARDVRANPQEFGFEETFVAKGIIFGRLPGGRTVRGIGGKWSIVPLFALKASVTQPARPFLIPTVTENAKAITAEIETALRAFLGSGEADTGAD
jgi:hypothetical protein